MKHPELRQLIREEIEKINVDSDYIKLNIKDQNLFQSYWLLGELLNPINSYNYEEEAKGYWVFIDEHGYDFFVRIVYQPVGEGYWEVKFGWVDLPNQQKYLRQPAREIDEKRSDTIAKIYRDEVIPFFLNQDFNNNLLIIPLDIKRYQFSLRLAKKFTPNNIEIIEDKPNQIILKKQ
jgi:hypothetical protein